MLIRQGFKYSLRIKPQTEALLRRWVGCRRFVYNEALAFQIAEVAAGRLRPGYIALYARLKQLRMENPWLADPPAQALQQALIDLCQAWDRKDKLGFGAPHFKMRGAGDTIRFPQSCTYDAAAGAVRIPKLGRVRLRHSRPAVGTLKNVTLRPDGGRWIVSLQTEREVEVVPSTATGEVGLDFGVKTSIMPSCGNPITLPARISRYERRVRRLQRALSRKQKGSNSRRKTAVRLRGCHRRITAIRRDFLHKETTKLVRSNALIAIEDLRVKNMTMSAAGTVDSPGKNVRQKSSLNRAILRNAWSVARKMLEYKAAWAGVTLVAVPARHSSQECSECCHIAAANRPSQALFRCVACGYEDHADRNAAKVVKGNRVFPSSDN
jgi:putative transposase